KGTTTSNTEGVSRQRGAIIAERARLKPYEEAESNSPAVDLEARISGERFSRRAIECLHEIFETWVDGEPTRPALVCGQVTLSYAELESRSNQLAHYLRARGVGRGSLVGIWFERSELPIIALLSCLKAGAAYVPIDPGFPDDRV